jgi:hypothetical protein
MPILKSVVGWQKTTDESQRIIHQRPFSLRYPSESDSDEDRVGRRLRGHRTRALSGTMGPIVEASPLSAIAYPDSSPEPPPGGLSVIRPSCQPRRNINCIAARFMSCGHPNVYPSLLSRRVVTEGRILPNHELD